MFHFHFKDYLFLILIAVAIVVLGGAVYLSGNPNNPSLTMNGSSNKDAVEIPNTGAFDCDGDTFTLSAPVENFEFNHLPLSQGMEKNCSWVSDNYRFIYTRANSSFTGPYSKAVIEGFSEVMNRGLKLIESRELDYGLEAIYLDEQAAEYQVSRFIINGDRIYFLGYYSPSLVTSDDPNYRAFVDSFRVIK